MKIILQPSSFLLLLDLVQVQGQMKRFYVNWPFRAYRWGLTMYFFSDCDKPLDFVFLIFDKIIGGAFLSSVLVKPMDDIVHSLLGDDRKWGFGVMSLAGVGVRLAEFEAHFSQNTPFFL